MKRLLAILAIALIPTHVYGQAQVGAGQVLGNSTAVRAAAQASSMTSILDRAFSTTNGMLLQRGASSWVASTLIPNLNNAAAAGAATTSFHQTGAAVGSANPIKYVSDTGTSPIFGIAYSGWYSLINYSVDGSYTASDFGDVQRYTADRTTDSGTKFINPVGIPLVDDGERYFYGSQHFTAISKSQAVLNECYTTAVADYTISGGQLTAIAALGNAPCTGNIYTPSSTIKVRLLSGSGTACTTLTANINGAGAIASYNGLPCGSGLSSASSGGNYTDNLLYFQPPATGAASNCSGNGCSFDVGPQIYVSRQAPTYFPRAGSALGSVFFSGASDDAGAKGSDINYASLNATVSDPTKTSPDGILYVGTASVFSQNGGNTPRVGIGKGLFLTGAGGVETNPLSDLGAGFLHANGLGIASGASGANKWTIFSNSSGNNLDFYNVNTAAIAWSIGTTGGGLYAPTATGGDAGVGIVNAKGFSVDNIPIGGIATAWTSYVPTIICGAGTMTSGVASGQYKIVGKTTFFNARIVITTNGTCASFLGFTLPNTIANASTFVGRNHTTGALISGAGIAAATSVSFTTATGTYPGADATTLGSSGVYENQ